MALPLAGGRSLKWRAGTLTSAKNIRGGDAITIGYQLGKMTIAGVYVAKIDGSGSVTVRKVEKDH